MSKILRTHKMHHLNHLYEKVKGGYAYMRMDMCIRTQCKDMYVDAPHRHARDMYGHAPHLHARDACLHAQHTYNTCTFKGYVRTHPHLHSRHMYAHPPHPHARDMFLHAEPNGYVCTCITCACMCWRRHAYEFKQVHAYEKL